MLFDSPLNISILLDPNKDTYQRQVFSILDLFGTLGGIFGLLSSACGMIVGVISSQILLSSVFRRLYFTNPLNFESIVLKVLGMRNKVKQMPEEDKSMSHYKQMNPSNLSKFDDSSSNNDVFVKIEPNSRNRVYEDDSVQHELRKLQATVKHRRRYQAN